MTLFVTISLAITALAVLATAWTVLKAIREAYSDGYHQGWEDGQIYANNNAPSVNFGRIMDGLNDVVEMAERKAL